MAFGKIYTQNTVDQLVKAVNQHHDFFSCFRKYLAFPDKLAKQKKFTADEKQEWLTVLNRILELGYKSSIDEITAKQLIEHVVFCCINTVDINKQPVRMTIKSLCKVIALNKLNPKLIEFTANVLEKKYAHIACLIYSTIAPSSPNSLAFFRGLWTSLEGRDTILQFAVPNFEEIVPTTFAEPAYSQNKGLLEWIRGEFPPNYTIQLATKLVLGLWQGRYVVSRPDQLDREFYDYFENQPEAFAKEVVFAIACMTLKMDKLAEFASTNGEIQIPWAGNYQTIIKAFIQSLNSQYPEIAKLTILPPKDRNFPRPIFHFMLMVYASYATRHLRDVNIEATYNQVSGPWEKWVNQLGSKEFPYQNNPDIKKFEELLHSELTTPEIKAFIAPWIVEMTYFREGYEAAISRVSRFPNDLRSSSQERLSALLGEMPKKSVDEITSVNDCLNSIRRAIVHRDTGELEWMRIEGETRQIHVNEQKMIALALKRSKGEKFKPEDIADAKRIAERGLPAGLFLVCQQIFEDGNFVEASTLLETCCNKAPGITLWREFFAQALANCGENEQALAALTPHESHLSPESLELLAWCSFTHAFPTKGELLKFALYPGTDLSEEALEHLHKADALLKARVCSLRSLVQAILQQLENPNTEIAETDFPEFASEWYTVSKALCEQDTGAFLSCLDDIQAWKTSYSKDVIKELASRHLGGLSPEDLIAEEHLLRLLKIVGKTREDFYAAQFYKDLKSPLSASEIHDKYKTIYSEDHPVFKLVAVYMAAENAEYARALEHIKTLERNGEHEGLCLLEVHVCAESQDWPQFLRAALNFCTHFQKHSTFKPLILLGVQIAIALDDPIFLDFMSLAAKPKIGIDALPALYKSHLMRQSLANAGATKDDKLSGLLHKTMDPKFQALLAVVTSPFEELLTRMPDMEASGKWGMFIYKKAVKFLLEKVGKTEASVAAETISEAVPPILDFVQRNKIDGIHENEIKALQALRSACQNQDKCQNALTGIFDSTEIGELIPLSKALLEDLQFPNTVEAFIKQATAYVKAEKKMRFDRLAQVIAVMNCWLESMQDRKSMNLQIYGPLLAFLTQIRVLNYTLEGFDEWYLKKREQLPENQRYLEEAREYMHFPVFEWFVKIYSDALNHFFGADKLPVARLYAGQIHELATNISGLLREAGFAKYKLNDEVVSTVQGLFEECGANWVKEKKGNLESQMAPLDDQKVFYRFNYQLGIEIIQRILAVFPKDKESLVLGLDYCNRWNKDHEDRANTKSMQIKDGSKASGWINSVINDYSNAFADALRPHCEPGEANSHLFENQALADHFYFKALVENQKKPYNNIEQILKWDPTHDKILWFYRDRFIEEFNDNKITAGRALERTKKFKQLFSHSKRAQERLAEDISSLS